MNLFGHVLIEVFELDMLGLHIFLRTAKHVESSIWNVASLECIITVLEALILGLPFQSFLSGCRLLMIISLGLEKSSLA